MPALFHEEIISGVATRGATVYPQQIGLACSFNPDLAFVKTQQTAKDMRMIGGLLALSPMVDGPATLTSTAMGSRMAKTDTSRLPWAWASCEDCRTAD